MLYKYIRCFNRYGKIIVIAVVVGCFLWAVNQYRGDVQTGLFKSVLASPGEKEAFIVIDSGHGFFDAGKLGVNGSEEKSINLSIASKLRNLLEQQGYKVKMTRENDEYLYDGSRPDTKREDMRKRAALINDEHCILAVSIHQNSFEKKQYRGAQTFYYSKSQESYELAVFIQQSLKERLDKNNERKEKGNSEYYLLKKTKVPMVICECGFLSNEEEAELLMTDEYQEKAAWAVSIGILQYMNREEN